MTMWNDEDNNPYGAFDEHDEQVTASIHGSGVPRESAFASAFVPLTAQPVDMGTPLAFSVCIYIANTNSYNIKINC